MLVGMPIARGTSNGQFFLCGLISMAMMPDAYNVFVGFMPLNSTYFNGALIQDMINEYGQDHRQGMQGIVHCMQGIIHCMQGGMHSKVKEILTSPSKNYSHHLARRPRTSSTSSTSLHHSSSSCQKAATVAGDTQGRQPGSSVQRTDPCIKETETNNQRWRTA
jgi:hypothetical protein